MGLAGLSGFQPFSHSLWCSFPHHRPPTFHCHVHAFAGLSIFHFSFLHLVIPQQHATIQYFCLSHSFVEFVGPQQPNGEMAQWGKMTRLGFEPRTSQLYTGCSNH